MDDDAGSNVKCTMVRLAVAGICCTIFWGCSLPRVHHLSDPLTAEEHLNLGVAYEQQQRYEEAQCEYRKALDAGSPKARAYLGNIAFLTGNLSEAEALYQKAIDDDPQNADVYNNLAWLYYQRGIRYDYAEALAMRAVELDPQNEDYKHTLKSIRAWANSGEAETPESP